MTSTEIPKETIPREECDTSESSSSSDELADWESYVCIRHNYSQTVERTVNELINQFYYAAYTCRSMQFYFERDHVALFGVAEFVCCLANCQLEFVRKLEDYQVLRGGQVHLTEIRVPEKDEWGTPFEAFEYLIGLFKLEATSCSSLHDVCEKAGDEHLKDELETEFLQPLYTTVRKIGVLMSNLQLAGHGIGEYKVNRDLDVHLGKILKENSIKLNNTILPLNRHVDLHSALNSLNIV
jgi:ferritin